MRVSGNTVAANGLRIKELQTSRPITHEKLAEETGLSIAVIKKALNNGTVKRDTLARLAQALSVAPPALILDEHPGKIDELIDKRSYNFDGHCFDALRLWGSDSDFVGRERFHVLYEHYPYRPHRELIDWINSQHLPVRELSWDTPTVYLYEYSSGIAATFGSARELTELHVKLRPLAWSEYNACNVTISGRLARNDYEKFLSINTILNRRSFKETKVTSTTSCVVTIVSSDGYVGYTVRSMDKILFRGRLSASMVESINRFRDESTDDGTVINDLMVNKGKQDHTYVPLMGKPNPFTTVRFGIEEELSRRLQPFIAQNATKLTGIAYSLEEYVPELLFLVAINQTRDEILRHVQENPGRDTHFEAQQLHFTPADFSETETRKLLIDPRWCGHHKASLFRAIEIIEGLSDHGSRSWSEVFRILQEAS